MDADLLVAADVLFLLEQPFKFRRENCIIVPVRWMWLSSKPGGSWSVTFTSLTVPNSGRGQHSPCGGGRSLSSWATSLSMVTVGVVELLFLLALACQSSCVLTRVPQFRLWASFLRIWLRSFSFTNSDSNNIWRSCRLISWKVSGG